ncbi:Nudix hydrolase domain-containing protein [[Candida] zeylanoides]
MSLLRIVDNVDNFPYDVPQDYVQLLAHEGTAIGYLTPQIAQRLAQERPFERCATSSAVRLAASLDTFNKRNAAIAEIAHKWRQLPEFEEALARGWRDELYTVYNPSHTPYMLIERVFSVLLGVVTYGVHINGYVPADGPAQPMRLWVPRRAATKSTYPGMLDNTVAGGVGHPFGVWETVVKECHEEAGLDPQFVVSHTTSAGAVSYMYQPQLSAVAGLVVQPEVEYVFDMRFDNATDVVPFPEDGEAESFALMDVEDVVDRVRRGEFKPNCGLIIVDFLIRHGYIAAESDPDYLELLRRCHRRIPFPVK